jgi:hypothetical protein
VAARSKAVRVSHTPRPLFTPGKNPVPIVQEGGWAPGPVWTGAENLAPSGFDPRTVQHVASSYNDYATRPTEDLQEGIANWSQWQKLTQKLKKDRVKPTWNWEILWLWGKKWDVRWQKECINLGKNGRQKQEKRSTYKRNIDAPSNNHYWSGRAISITYSECVYRALFIQQAKRICHITI